MSAYSSTLRRLSPLAIAVYCALLAACSSQGEARRSIPAPPTLANKPTVPAKPPAPANEHGVRTTPLTPMPKALSVPTAPAPELSAPSVPLAAPTAPALPPVATITPPPAALPSAPGIAPALTAPPVVPNAPPAVLALLSEADSARSKSDWEGAAAALERALRLQPRSGVLWHRLADVRLRQDYAQMAVEMAKKSIALTSFDRPLQQRNWLLIAEAKQRLGDSTGAAEARRQAATYSTELLRSE